MILMGVFPNGIPNPLLPENRPVSAAAVRAAGADFGVAFDGDFDRCFLFDGEGGFVDGEHVVALLAAAHLVAEPGSAIVHDPQIDLGGAGCRSQRRRSVGHGTDGAWPS